jgi:peroxiredoxin family protein
MEHSHAEAAPTRSSDELADLVKRIESLEQQVSRGPQPDSLSMVVFSGELDKLLAAFVIATGGAACGMNVSMFFTFWGTAALKKAAPQVPGKSVVERMFGWMLPGGFGRRKLSQLDMAGMGRWMMLREMQKKHVADLPTLVQTADELDVEIRVCEMSMSLMGIRPEELIDYSNLDFCGVAGFLDKASSSGTTLFI